jgi:hypothetical protein
METNYKHATDIIQSHIDRLEFIKNNIELEVKNYFFGINNCCFDLECSSIYLNNYYNPDKNDIHKDRTNITEYLNKF